MCTPVLQPVIFAIIAIPLWDIFGAYCLGAAASVESASLQSMYRSSAISYCVKSLERPGTCAIKQHWPFSHQSPSVCLLPFFCVFPFSFPQGGVAFTASNYRLYQSYISPYISVDLSRHLKGQLIALWQACAWPLKEKSRSEKPNTYTQTHTYTFLSLQYLSRLSFLYHFNFPLSLWDSFHCCCVITLVISRNKEEQNIFLSTSILH